MEDADGTEAADAAEGRGDHRSVPAGRRRARDTSKGRVEWFGRLMVSLDGEWFSLCVCVWGTPCRRRIDPRRGRTRLDGQARRSRKKEKGEEEEEEDDA